MNQKLLLWGCGERCKYILQQKMLSQEDVIGFIDGKPGRDSFFDKPVYSPESVREKLAMDSSIHILVTVRNAVLEIHETIEHLGIPADRVAYLYNYYQDREIKTIAIGNQARLKAVSEDLFSEGEIYLRDLQDSQNAEMGWKNFEIMKVWMEAKLAGKSLGAYLNGYDFQSIALYGAGEIGRLAVADLGDARPKVKYIIDQLGNEINNIDGIPVVSVEQAKKNLPEAVLVTSITAYESIYNKLLHEAPQVGVLSLREIIYEL